MIECKIDGHIAVVTLNNPSANTFTAAGLLQLETLIGELNLNMDVYAVVISGQGEKFFSAGADLKMFADGDKARAREVARRFGRDGIVTHHTAHFFHQIVLDGNILGGAPRRNGHAKKSRRRFAHSELQPFQNSAHFARW